jgi:hypothetical protein
MNREAVVAIAKNIIKWRPSVRDVINELVSQSWTIFGLLVGWIVLPDGDTRNFVGSILMWLTIAWLVTMPIRLREE